MGRRSRPPRQAAALPAVPGKKAQRQAARVAAALAREQAARTPRQVRNGRLEGRIDVADKEIRRIGGPTVPPEMERPLMAPLERESDRRRLGLSRAQEVLSSYRQHRKAGYLPGVALNMALYDWDL